MIVSHCTKRALLPYRLHLHRYLTFKSDDVRTISENPFVDARTISEKPLVVKLATSSLCSEKIQQRKSLDQIQFSDTETRFKFYDNFEKRYVNRSPLCPFKSIVAIESHDLDDVFNTIKFIEIEKEKIQANVVSVGLIVDRALYMKIMKHPHGGLSNILTFFMNEYDIIVKFITGKDFISQSELSRREFLLLLEAPFHTDYDVTFIAVRELLELIWTHSDRSQLELECLYDTKSSNKKLKDTNQFKKVRDRSSTDRQFDVLNDL